MEDIKFNSLNELYDRLYPAFNTKKNELKREKINVREIDIWNFLKENKWSLSSNLSIYKMVNDIFNVDKIQLIKYIDNTK